jgi:hypothetical protein
VVAPYEVSGSRMGVALHPGDRQLPGHGPRRPGWRLEEEVEVQAGARLDGTAIGQIRAADPEVRILAITQRGAGAAAFPAPQMR